MDNIVNNLLSKLRNKRIIITGSSGYIGSEMMKLLQEHVSHLIGIDKLPSEEKNCQCLNLSSGKEVSRLVEEFRPDTIFHLGTHSALAYKQEFLSSYDEDSTALVNILTAVKNRSVRLIFTSSSYVYSGIQDTQSVSEDTLFQSEHPFGIAKSFFEQLVRRTHPDSVVFRLASVFGPGKALHPNAVYNMALECRQNGKLTVWGTGQRMMQYVYIADVLKFFLEGCFLGEGIYNLGGENYISVAQSAELIAKTMRSEVEYLPDKQEGMTLPFMNVTKLKSASPNPRFQEFANVLEEYLNSIEWK